MTLEELERTLPNGLHDAQVQRIAIDYEQRKASLELAVWVGAMDDPPKRREAYKRGRLDITGLTFLVVEPLDPKYPFTTSGLTINGCDMSKNISGELLKSLPHNSFFRSLWVNEWNAFIAAKDVNLVWMNDGAIAYGKAKS